MTSKLQRLNLGLAILILLSVLLMFGVNRSLLHYAPVTYLPVSLVLRCVMVLTLLSVGCAISEWPHALALTLRCHQIFLMICLIALFTQAVQLTPFTPIDHWLLRCDHHLGFRLEHWVRWTSHHPDISTLLNLAYGSLNTELTLALCVLAISDNQPWRHRFIAYFLLTTLLGFFCYYFLPTLGPATTLKLPEFSGEQFYTGEKFHLVHAGVTSQERRGGMIAMPSFHAIWAVICQMLWQRWPKVAACTALWNGLIICSCVGLGWHYLTDLVVSIMVLWLSQRLLHWA